MLRHSRLDAATAVRAHGLDGKTVAEHGVVSRLIQPRLRQGESGGEQAVAVAHLDERAYLVDGEEIADAVTELGGCEARIGGEGLRRVARFPAASILQHLRPGPIIESGERVYSGGQQLG